MRFVLAQAFMADELAAYHLKPFLLFFTVIAVHKETRVNELYKATEYRPVATF